MQHDKQKGVTVVQSVCGNWNVVVNDKQLNKTTFRRCGDAREWCAAEGHVITGIKTWESFK